MATPIFCCGFEEGVTGVHWTLSASNSFSTGTVRSGARSLRSNPTAANSGQANTVLSSPAIVVARFYVRFATLPTTDASIAAANNGGVGVFFKSSDSKIYAGVNETTLGATGVSVTTGVWYRIDMMVDKTNNPWTIDVQVDGTACGQRTNAVAAGTSSLFVIGIAHSDATTVTGDAFYDDFILSVTGADYPFGAGQVDHFVPTADGTHNVAGAADFKRGAAGVDITNSTTDSYLLVDDIPMDTVGSAPTTNDYINAIAPPNATDYTENVFGPAPGISTPTTGPRAVDVIVETAQAATQTGSFKLNLNDNGTLDTVKEQVGVAGATAVAAARKHYATAPSTGVAWTSALFNNLRIRFYSADAAPDQYFVAAMIEAEFAAVAAFSNYEILGRPMGASGQRQMNQLAVL